MDVLHGQLTAFSLLAISITCREIGRARKAWISRKEGSVVCHLASITSTASESKSKNYVVEDVSELGE